MMRSVFVISTALAFGQQALATAMWGQCGGMGFTGDKNCDAGSVCTAQNDWYSQCLAGTAATTSKVTPVTPTTSAKPVQTTTSSKPVVTVPASSTVKPTTTSQAPTTPTTPAAPGSPLSFCSASRTKFTYFGVNESGAEFGEGNIPGTLGKDYTWPEPSSIDYFVGKGLNTFRVPFHWGRLTPNGLTGSYDAAYLAGLQKIVNYITAKGAYAAIEPHNYFRYNGQFPSSNDFAGFWKNLATTFKGNDHVIFDLINEPNGVDATVVAKASQAAINAIRAAGATKQLILVEGTAWTGAWSWVSSGNADAFKSITDPNNNWAIEMHQYLDSDSSGTSPNCVSATIGAERLAAATAWLKANNIRGFLGEMGAGNNDVCTQAIQKSLCALQSAGGVWIGATWWAAGPWWGDYMYSAEPTSGPALNGIFTNAWLPFA